MSELFFGVLLVFNQILHAGNAITAFSLLLYTLTFNMRERVARSFAILLACVTVVYFGDVMAGLSDNPLEIERWLRFQWLGIGFVPAAYLDLSDALLDATGRPSRGRRRFVVRIGYLSAGGFVLLAGLTELIAGPLSAIEEIFYLKAGALFPLFMLFLLASLVFAAVNFWRAYKRCLTRTSRRRMAYLMFGSIGPVLGTVPFLMIAAPTSTNEISAAIWLALIPLNTMIAAMMVLMAYAVAYFGVSSPDRVVKSRLFQWIIRGPVVASTVLAVTVIMNRVSTYLGMENSLLVPFTMVATILLLQYMITIIRPVFERWLFYGEDRNDIARLQLLEARLLTTGDLKQFLESVLNAVCDVSGSESSFVALLDEDGLVLEVAVGEYDPLRNMDRLPPLELESSSEQVEPIGEIFQWGPYWLLPLRSPDSKDLIGLLGIFAADHEFSISYADGEMINALRDKAAVALTDRLLQREVFRVVDRLVPQVEEIQRIRAAARYQGAAALTSELDEVSGEADLANLVKDALGHYWGGPRLSKSPLLRLKIVNQLVDEHGGNPIHALRQVLKSGIDRTRPEGERRFTAEWMLYNILEMKFLEGRKVRDVAMRLAMSEADLYRKQRVAFEMVAQAIADMEREASSERTSKEEILVG